MQKTISLRGYTNRVYEDTLAQIKTGERPFLSQNQIAFSQFSSAMVINPFYATDLFWYPLKTSENQRFSDVFRGYQKRPVAWNGLKKAQIKSKLSGVTLNSLQQTHMKTEVIFFEDLKLLLKSRKIAAAISFVVDFLVFFIHLWCPNGKGVRGSLKICHVFADFSFNERSNIHFCRWRSQNWSFFQDVTNCKFR